MNQTIRWDPWKISANDAMDFHAETGLNLQSYFQSFLDNPPTGDQFMDPENLVPLTAFIWIMMRQSQPDVTLQEVRASGLLELTELIELVEVPEAYGPASAGPPAGQMERPPTASERREMVRAGGTAIPRQFGQPPPEGRQPE